MAARRRSAGGANNQNHPGDTGQAAPKKENTILVTPRKILKVGQQVAEPAQQVRDTDRRAGRRKPSKPAKVPPLVEINNDEDRRIVVVGEKATALPRTAVVNGQATAAVRTL